MSKKSIRFFNDREVRAVWDDENNCWWFSAIDVVRAINDEPDYTKAGNYWRWLKRKLRQEGIQLVSATHGFKFEAPNKIIDVVLQFVSETHGLKFFLSLGLSKLLYQFFKDIIVAHQLQTIFLVGHLFIYLCAIIKVKGSFRRYF